MCGEPAIGWRAVGCSVRGAAHIRKGIPNQDAWGAWHGIGGTPLALGVVADGHGSSRCVRSATGARIAVESAHRVVEELAKRLLRSPSIVPDVPRLLIEEWRERVADHLIEHPLTEKDLPESLPPHTRRDLALNPVNAYGTTLLVCIAAPSRIIAVQVGDGDVLAVGGDGQCKRCVASDLDSIGNETHSMCELDASVFRIGVLELEPGDRGPSAVNDSIVLMSTDGISNAFRSDVDFYQLATDLHADVRRRPLDEVAADLPGWLADYSKLGSGDDVTLCLLYRFGLEHGREQQRLSSLSDLPPTLLARSRAQTTTAGSTDEISKLMPRTIAYLSPARGDHEQ